ncbi:MAG TPA: ATP-grasp domain-containing protein, partial [Acidimicrobiales bacterium]|nr:ATP-grasp domain-containing protein [Acidimicrobiales bacterium]
LALARGGRPRTLLVRVAPAPLDPRIAADAREIADGIARAADVVGMLTVELFLLPDGSLLVNELAARPHNTGHLTIEACATSQFTNHLLAVLDRPLGPTALRAANAVMVNVVGAGDHDLGAADRAVVTSAADAGVHVHLYGKRARVGRKLGHVTAVGRDLDATRRRAAAAAEHLRRRTLDSAIRGAAS